MELTFDPAKDAANREKHGISLQRAADMDIALVIEDDRFDYGEKRYRAFGLIDEDTYCLVFTVRGGAMRAISLRRAGEREMNRYVRKQEEE
jgi:uncharacterized DUF497 family protein